MRLVSFCLFLVLAFTEARVTYYGEKVLNCRLEDPSIVEKLSSLDVWGVVNRTIDIRVKNGNEQQFVESLLPGCTVTIPDLEEFIRRDDEHRASVPADAAWFDEYHPYNELNDWYTNLAATYPNYIKYVNIGQATYLGNNLKVLVISTSGNSSKPIVYFQGQIHAREWIAGATVNYIVNQLITDYFVVPRADVVTLLDSITLHIVPVLNIDGYMYTWATNGDRLWRKNRAPTPSANCIGTDINRNYNDHWGGSGSSALPCDDTYRGPSVASEEETQGTQNYFKQIAATAPVIVGIDWHSYSQLVLRPFGWTEVDSPNEGVLKAQGDAYAATILATSGLVYTSEKSIDLYITTGTASDWFYGEDASSANRHGGCLYKAAGYTVELRPARNPPGFRLPPEEIIPCGNENYRALIPFLSYWASNPIRTCN